MEQGAQVVKAEDALTARSEPVLHGKAQGVETRGISLQGMTAVQQVLEDSRICYEPRAHPSRPKPRWWVNLAQVPDCLRQSRQRSAAMGHPAGICRVVARTRRMRRRAWMASLEHPPSASSLRTSRLLGPSEDAECRTFHTARGQADSGSGAASRPGGACALRCG